MLRSLATGERNIGELAAPFRMSLAAASKHVKVLESAGLVRRKVQGRSHICRIEPSPLAAADRWLRYYERFWNKRLDARGFAESGRRFWWQQIMLTRRLMRVSRTNGDLVDQRPAI